MDLKVDRSSTLYRAVLVLVLVLASASKEKRRKDILRLTTVTTSRVTTMPIDGIDDRDDRQETAPSSNKNIEKQDHRRLIRRTSSTGSLELNLLQDDEDELLLRADCDGTATANIIRQRQEDEENEEDHTFASSNVGTDFNVNAIA